MSVIPMFSLYFLTVCFYAEDAFAYIDPNTGGYIFQLLFPILSAIVGILLFFKNSVKNIFAAIVRAVFRHHK